MILGRGRLHWYDIILVGLAALIVYPDKVLDWLGERTGREFGWWYVVWLEIVAIGLMLVAMLLLMPVYPKLHWWYPLLAVGMLALFRFVMWLLLELFGFRDL